MEVHAQQGCSRSWRPEAAHEELHYVMNVLRMRPARSTGHGKEHGVLLNVKEQRRCTAPDSGAPLVSLWSSAQTRQLLVATLNVAWCGRSLKPCTECRAATGRKVQRKRRLFNVEMCVPFAQTSAARWVCCNELLTSSVLSARCPCRHTQSSRQVDLRVRNCGNCTASLRFELSTYCVTVCHTSRWRV